MVDLIGQFYGFSGHGGLFAVIPFLLCILVVIRLIKKMII